MNTRLALLALTQQFYKDCCFISETSALQPVDEDSCLLFNNLLRDIQAAYGACELVHHFREMAPRNIKFKDAVMVSGQLVALMQALTEENYPVGEGKSVRPEEESASSAPSASSPPPPAASAPPAASPAKPPTPHGTITVADESATPREFPFRPGAGTAAPSSPPQKLKKSDQPTGGFLTEEETRVSYKDLK